MSKSATMAISSVTGNTIKIAEGARSALNDLGWRVSEFQKGTEPADDVVIVCFWCRKSSLDPASIEVVNACHGKKILALGTFGGYPQSRYADLVRSNVEELISVENECLGVFLSQGKVSMRRIEQRRQLPETDPHYLDDWGVERLMEGQNHPNSSDVQYARAFTRDYLPTC